MSEEEIESDVIFVAKFSTNSADPTICLSEESEDEKDSWTKVLDSNNYEPELVRDCNQADLHNLSILEPSVQFISEEESKNNDSWTTALSSLTDVPPSHDQEISVCILQDVNPRLKKLSANELFHTGTNLPRDDLLKEHLIKGGRLEETAILRLIQKGSEVLVCDDNILYIDPPIFICGDILGEFFDLLKIFDLGGSFNDRRKKYLFLGNYSSTTKFSMECLIYLWALKINYRCQIHLLRGSNETRKMSAMLKTECETKYSKKIYDAWMHAFDYLPLSAVIDRRFLCLHAGLSPAIRKLEDIKNIRRYEEPSYDCPVNAFCDLLWSDPCDDYGHETREVMFHKKDFAHTFSYKACCNFLRQNHLIGIIRGHQPQENGCKMYRLTKNNFPSLISIFSAKNYLGIVKKGAFLKYLSSERIVVKQF